MDFHGERRQNATHQSTTDPEARLAKKGAGKEARLCYTESAHALTRHVARPIGGVQVERRAARPALILRHVGSDIERAATRHERRLS